MAQDSGNSRGSDLDHFKQINDTLGHAAGDAVIAATADRLSTWAGNRAAVGRLGGDEFALTLRIAPERWQTRLAQLVQKLTQPVVLDNHRVVQVAASIGAAAANTLRTPALPVLQRAADTALYRGKHTGHAVLATPADLTVASVNGRRAGRPGTHTMERNA
ncbi:GGDEF domain-containing protein [Streptomyces sp. NPDC060022]|uniref:GGDEF domain-containing protein n=1 Tax=Streptomyces sp. NPDC060022 TaxID=3347039 RepID=UPI00367FD44D